MAERVARGEINRSPRDGWGPYRDILARNLLTLFNALVVPAAVALFLLGDYRGAWAVSAMALINTLIGLIQEVRAKRHLDKLAVLTEPRARVRRDGDEQQISAADVVRGDLVLLCAGDAVVADGTVQDAHYLEIDEALLTGESDPVPRRSGERLLSGSICIAGAGSYRADNIGATAFAQELAAEARRYHYTPSPMQRVLDALIRVLTATAVVLCVLYVVLQFARGFPRTDLWQMIAATVTSMVPQGLVLMATLALTLGAVRLSTRGAVVQRLGAVEAMASIDVLCLDKTGTLTTNRLTLARVQPIGRRTEAAVRNLLRDFAGAALDGKSKTILALQEALGPGPVPDVAEHIPFKSKNRYSAVRLRREEREQVLALGAFEALVPLLADPAVAEAAWRELLPSGLRLLMFAEGDGGTELGGSLAGATLRPLGLVGLGDELRPEAGQILSDFLRQGIDLKIISGDNPDTVRATVAELALASDEAPVVTGDQFAAAADRATLVRAATVFGRVAPRQKLDIVAELQRQGRRVGMVGDGVNDVLPIKRADLGVAMGEGSAAARTVAGLVLENNDFALLPHALDEGRTVVRNLRRAAKLFLLKNVFTLVLIVAGLGLFGLGFPYLPQQVTLLNGLTIGGPALVILLGRAASDGVQQRGFLREVGLFALAAGLITGAAGLCLWLWSADWGDEARAQRTMLLTMLVLAGLGNMLVVAEGDRRLFAWAAAALPAYVAVMYLQPIAYFFDLAPLTAWRWMACLGAAATAVAASAGAAWRLNARRRGAGEGRGPAAGDRKLGGPGV